VFLTGRLERGENALQIEMQKEEVQKAKLGEVCFSCNAPVPKMRPACLFQEGIV
jgi:hypothetical protein